MPPRLAKLLAFLVAVALVAGAFWYRSRSDGGGLDIGGSGGTVKVACITELADVCRTALGEGFDLTVADAGETAEELAASEGAAPYSAWVTLDPWPAMVDVERRAQQRSPLFGDRATRHASTDVRTLSTPGARGDAARWDRLAARARTGANIGVPAHDTALGAVVEGQAAAGIVGNADFGNEVFAEMVPELEAALRSATRLGGEEQLTRMVVQQGSYDAVAGFGFLVERTARTPEAERRRLVAVDTEPRARADVVVATTGTGDRADRVTEQFTGETGAKALEAEGWTVPATKGPTGLPDPDVLVALRKEIE